MKDVICRMFSIEIFSKNLVNFIANHYIENHLKHAKKKCDIYFIEFDYDCGKVKNALNISIKMN